MTDIADLPPAKELKDLFSVEEEKENDNDVLDRFQMALTDRRQQSTKRARTMKDFITGIWVDSKCDFGSPFPRREENSYAQWFVDGEDYMEHAANMISLAREEIFITDWWLSPQVYLKRPALDRSWRFDQLLKKKAEEGVRIYIQLFKELEMALGTIKSLDSKKILHRLHPNIKVIRHPDRISGIVFWSHHEKLLVIDQDIAYVGGLDFAFGRWDTHNHSLVDLGPEALRPPTAPVCGSSAVEGMKSVGKLVPQLSKDLVHCIQINGEDPVEQSSVGVDNGHDNDRPATSIWEGLKQSVVSFAHGSDEESDEEEDIKQGNYQDEPESDPEESHEKNSRQHGMIGKALGRVKHIYKRQKHKSRLRHDDNLYFEEGWSDLAVKDYERRTNTTKESTMFIGKDYVNFIKKNFVDLDKPEEDFVDRYSVPRMPWHDIHSVIYGSAARDVAQHFITRWNESKATKKKLFSWPELSAKKTEINVPRILRTMSYPCKVQLLRSACDWSIPGLDGPEQSIHQAYLHMIGNAKHYIYIENQFFVSLMSNEQVINCICHALCDRIVRAYEEQENFKVYIVIPLLPNFEGKIGEESGSALLAVMRWTYEALCRQPYSLFFNLKKRGVDDPHKYVSVCSLRTWDKLGADLVTELIYIHSKLMIVDDTSAIIGSANVNDRSLLGTRDSEIAIQIKDIHTEPSVMNGQPYKGGKFCGSLRRFLFREHLGDLNQEKPCDPSSYIPVDVTDPASNDFFRNVWNGIAWKNTEIFDEVFRCIPTNKVSTFEDLNRYRNVAPMCMMETDRAAQMVKGIQGHLVQFPMAFLNQSDLAPSIKSKEGMAPYQIFT